MVLYGRQRLMEDLLLSVWTSAPLDAADGTRPRQRPRCVDQTVTPRQLGRRRADYVGVVAKVPGVNAGSVEVLGVAEAHRAVVHFLDNRAAPCYNSAWPGSAGSAVLKAFGLTFPAVFVAAPVVTPGNAAADGAGGVASSQGSPALMPPARRLMPRMHTSLNRPP